MGLNLSAAILNLGQDDKPDPAREIVTDDYDRSSFLTPHRRVDVRGNVIEFLTGRSSGFHDQVILKSIVPPGVATPLQSQTEPQTVLILSGRIDVRIGDVWRPWSQGESLRIEANQKYALRNTRGEKVVMVLVTTPALARFLEDAGQPLTDDGPATPAIEGWSRYVDAVRRHGHWVDHASLPDAS